MHRALAGNFDQLVGHHSIDAALDTDDAFEAINFAGPTLGGFTAILAVLGRQLAVPDADGEAAKRELLVLGIDPQRHRCARAQSRRQIIVGAWPAIEAACRCRLVGQETMAASNDGILELSCARFRHHDAVLAILTRALLVQRNVA